MRVFNRAGSAAPTQDAQTEEGTHNLPARVAEALAAIKLPAALQFAAHQLKAARVRRTEIAEALRAACAKARDIKEGANARSEIARLEAELVGTDGEIKAGVEKLHEAQKEYAPRFAASVVGFRREAGELVADAASKLRAAEQALKLLRRSNDQHGADFSLPRLVGVDVDALVDVAERLQR